MLPRRPRPDFLARCFPHGVPAEVPLEDGFPACEEPGAPGVKDGYKSFPSGHASLAFAGLGFLTLPFPFASAFKLASRPSTAASGTRVPATSTAGAGTKCLGA